MKVRLPILCLVALLLSCGVAREPRVERMARVACDRFDSCGSLSDLDYGSYSECTADMEARFYDLWPADACDDGRMNRERYRECLDRASIYPCDANLVDFLSFLQACSAEEVCID